MASTWETKITFINLFVVTPYAAEGYLQKPTAACIMYLHNLTVYSYSAIGRSPEERAPLPERWRGVSLREALELVRLGSWENLLIDAPRVALASRPRMVEVA